MNIRTENRGDVKIQGDMLNNAETRGPINTIDEKRQGENWKRTDQRKTVQMRIFGKKKHRQSKI